MASLAPSASSSGPAQTTNRHSAPDPKPGLRDLLIELETVVDKWKPLMLELGVPPHVIETAVHNNKGDLYEQKWYVFNYWLKNDRDVSWSRVSKALEEVGERDLAFQLRKKYSWKDPRVKCFIHYIVASEETEIRPERVSTDVPGLIPIPPHQDNMNYFTLETTVSEQLTQSYDKWFKSEARNIASLPSIIKFFSIEDFFKSIEQSQYKDEFKVGYEARFGKMYYKLHHLYEKKPLCKKDCRAREFRKPTFNPKVKEEDVQKLIQDKKPLRQKASLPPPVRVTLNFEVDKHGIYRAVVLSTDNGERFHLNAVYANRPANNSAKYNISLPGKQYDVRVADCSEYFIPDPPTSTPYLIADKIVKSLRSCADGGLEMCVSGTYKRETWFVKHIRKRFQKQFEWRPDKNWILALIDVCVYDPETNAVKPKEAVLDKPIKIGFDYHRLEIELWGQKFFPKDVDETHPSRDDYYHMESVAGVRLSHEERKLPYNWTTEELIRDFPEFLQEALLIAHQLDGSVAIFEEPQMPTAVLKEHSSTNLFLNAEALQNSQGSQNLDAAGDIILSCIQNLDEYQFSIEKQLKFEQETGYPSVSRSRGHTHETTSAEHHIDRSADAEQPSKDDNFLPSENESSVPESTPAPENASPPCAASTLPTEQPETRKRTVEDTLQDQLFTPTRKLKRSK